MLGNRTLDINITDCDTGINAFWIACLYGHGRVMHDLASHGIDIFTRNHLNIDALHLAVMRNHISIVEMLVSGEFPLDHETEDGMTPLMLAAALNHPEIAMIIIDEVTGGDYKTSYVNKIISRRNPLCKLSVLSFAILSQSIQIAIKLIHKNA